MKRLSFLLIFSIAVIFTACYYDVELELYGSNSCDNSNVTFTNKIESIFSSKCQSCHNSTNNSGGVTLSNYTEIKDGCQNGNVICTIEQLDNTCSAMPTGGKLSDCDIDAIKTWSNSGYIQ